jgi:arabinoxylan arabinofuranohydrolase
MKRLKVIKPAVFLMVCVFAMAIFLACPADSDPKIEPPSPPSPEISGVEMEDQPAADVIADFYDTEKGFPAALSNSWKIWGHHNALMTQGFGADPTALPYKDRLYIISSNDTLLYNDGVVDDAGGYNAGIQGLRVLSSSDMANWTDHGLINVGDNPEWTNPLYLPMPAPVTPYKSKSWAPSAVWKKIDGKDKFFIYFGDSGDGIGVISADSPTGPWTSPLNKLLIDRNTPNCAANEVKNLFDPGAFVDDDGWGYLYFGGGGGGDYGRRVRLGKDLISLDTEPEKFTALNLFEDNEFTKIGDLYYYSYVNTGASIAYMTSYDPMGTLKDDFTPSTPKVIMASPQSQLGTRNENNHHCIFTFNGEHYITYHASTVSQAIGLTGVKYRSTFIDKINLNSDGLIDTITMTRKGVEQIENFNPYVINEAETIGIQGGVFTRPEAGAGNGMVVTSIDTGDWLALYGVDFGSKGATKFTVRVRMPETPADYVGAIELRLDPQGAGKTGDKDSLSQTNTATITDGEVIGRVQLKALDGKAGEYGKATIDLDKTVTGVHDLVFVFYSSLGDKPITKANLLESHHKNGFEFDQWQFSKE